jgi:hypothetical protein
LAFILRYLTKNKRFFTHFWFVFHSFNRQQKSSEIKFLWHITHNEDSVTPCDNFMREKPNKFSLSPINSEAVLIKGIRILRLVADDKPRHQVFLFSFYLFQIDPSELGIHTFL